MRQALVGWTINAGFGQTPVVKRCQKALIKAVRKPTCTGHAPRLSFDPAYQARGMAR